MSAYRTAIDETTGAIDLRARYFRNLIVTVVSIGALVVVAAFVAGARALWGWLLFVPACGVFFYIDARVLNRWRRTTLAAWIPREIDLEVLRKTLQAKAAIPKGTLEGMLSTMPQVGDLVAEQQLATPTRRAIAAASLAAHEGRASALLLQAIASGIAVGSVLAALWMRTYAPLLGLLPAAIVPGAGQAWVTRRQRARRELEIEQCRRDSEFSEGEVARSRDTL